MITLDKILSELKPGSLNEIVAGCGGGQTGKNRSRQKSGGARRSGNRSGGSSRSSKSGYSCGCHGPVVLT